MVRNSETATKKSRRSSEPENYDLDTHRVMSLIPLRPYHTVADIGCGGGYFTIPLGKHLFDGRVHAIDTRQRRLDAARAELERIRLTNVEFALYRGSKLPLEDGALDGALAAFSLHESSNPGGLLREIRRCLAQGGWLAVIEWDKRETAEGPPLEDRIDESDLRAMAEEEGFRFTGRHSVSETQYMLIMRV